MHGRICLVTGATNGVGLVTARALAEQGATVIAVGRNAARTQDTVSAIQTATGNTAVHGLVADLSSQRDVRALAQQVLARFPRLDVLVNNAGATFPRRAVTVDGIEMTLALNHLNYFLLTNLLLPALIASGTPGAAARIVNVSSEAHRRAELDWDDLQSEHRYSAWRTYCRSKLMNILFTYELDRRIKAGPAAGRVVTNCLHPGVVDSGFYDSRRGFMRAVYPLIHHFFISAERGARTQIYLASSSVVEGVTGKYFIRKRERRSSRSSYDPVAARTLWERSDQLAPAASAPAPIPPAA